MAHRQLTVEEREEIQRGLWSKESVRSIARRLGRSHTSIAREIARNKPPLRNQYTPRLAEERAREKRTSPTAMSGFLFAPLEALLLTGFAECVLHSTTSVCVHTAGIIGNKEACNGSLEEEPTSKINHEKRSGLYPYFVMVVALFRATTPNGSYSP